MSLVRAISRAAHTMKPKHGEPCNQCGACCQATLCPLGAHVLKMPEWQGPCPALEGEPGSATCGLVSNPAKWAPVRAAIYGKEAMSQSAQVLIGAGTGCDARMNGEAPNMAFYAELREFDKKNARAVKLAKLLWNWGMYG